MALTINDLLAPQVILGTISRMRIGQGRLGKWLGWHYGDAPTTGTGVLSGPNTRNSPVRSATYRIFDQTRTVAQGRAPGTGPGWTPTQPYGEMPFTCARFHEKIRMEAEKLAALATAFQANSVIDENGQQFIAQQEKYLAQRFNNGIELMAAGLIRGAFYMRQSGESWYFCINNPGGNAIKVDLKVPSGNTGQLNMLGTGSIIGTAWSNPAAPIISHDLPMILDAYTKLTGMQVAHIWCDPFVWAYVITNTQVINAAGSAMTPFTEYGYEDPRRGTDNGMVAQLRGFPMITWHITSEVVIDNNGTDTTYAAGTGPLTPVIPPNTITITPPAEDDWQELIDFGEPVSDSPGMPMVKRPGLYMWHEWITQPSAIEIIGLRNAIPALLIPKALVSGTVVF